MLQKLQRERVKSQTIEKKTNVADQEVNDLTGKNEDLTDQVKSLEMQLEESERKRESERADSAKEKEQWLRMLEMGGRLHSKNAEEKQRLRDEKSHLSERVAAYEEDNYARFDQIKRHFTSRMEAERPEAPETEGKVGSDSEASGFPDATGSISSTGEASNDVESLKREITILNARVEVLRSSLQETKRRNQELGEQAQEIVQRNSGIDNVISTALQDEEASNAKTKRAEAKQHHKTNSGRSTPTRTRPNWSPKLIPTVYPPSSVRALSKSPNPQEWRKTSSTSSSTISSIARAVSPGPEELGFHVTQSDQSPDELISQLNNLAPIPAVQFGTSPFPRSSNSSRHDGIGAHQIQPRKSNHWVGMGMTENHADRDKTNIGSFRPLTHHVPSPYASVGRVAEQNECGSYHSSPGPINMDDSSSGSGLSPEEDSSRSREDRVSVSSLTAAPSNFTTGLPQPPGTAKYAEAASAMPPPPRPT